MRHKNLNTDAIDDVIKGCLNNNRRSQKILFDTYSGKLMAVSYRYMGNQEDANEVLQEGFIKIFNNLTTYNPSIDIFYWMKRIIINLAIDKLRKQQRDRKIISSDQDDVFKTTDHDEIYNFDSFQQQQIVAQILTQAVSQLSPAYRSVFNLYVVEDYTHAEIAEMLGVSEGTSKSNYFKAKAKLKKLLENKINLVY